MSEAMKDSVAIHMSSLITRPRELGMAILEVRRELSTRQRAYQELIDAGDMHIENAQAQYDRLQSAHTHLMALFALTPVDHPHNIEDTITWSMSGIVEPFTFTEAPDHAKS